MSIRISPGLREEDLNFSSNSFQSKAKGQHRRPAVTAGYDPELQNRINGKVFKVNSETLNAVVNRGNKAAYRINLPAIRSVISSALRYSRIIFHSR